jgi:hypothetical protein
VRSSTVSAGYLYNLQAISDKFFAILHPLYITDWLAEREGIYKGFPDGEVLLERLMRLKMARIVK